MEKIDCPRSWHFRASGHFSLAGIGLLVVIIFAAGLAVWDRREDAIARSRQEMTTLGTVLAEQTGRSIQAIDLVLQQTQAMVHAAGADTAERFREVAATEAQRLAKVVELARSRRLLKKTQPA